MIDCRGYWAVVSLHDQAWHSPLRDAMGYVCSKTEMSVL